MTARDELLALQWAQLKHDEAYHKDVVILPLAQRIKHMALHNTKYTAYLIDAVKAGDDVQLNRTLVDAFIIALASANTLNQDLGGELGDCGTSTSLHQVGCELANSLAREADDALWMVHQFALQNGQLAKICESWDHLEPLPFREGMKGCVLALLKLVLAEAASKPLDLAEAYRTRIRAVETRSILDSHFREGAGGEA